MIPEDLIHKVTNYSSENDFPYCLVVAITSIISYKEMFIEEGPYSILAFTMKEEVIN
jgi:hypothetical protein